MAESVIGRPIESLNNRNLTGASTPSGGAVSVPTATWTRLTKFTLTKGIWLICAGCRYASNTTGRRWLSITSNGSTSSAGPATTSVASPLDGDYTYCRREVIIRINEDTLDYYLFGYQNSGSSLSVSSWAYRCVKLGMD